MKFSPPIPSCSNENFCFHIGDYSFGFNGKELDKEGMGGGASTYDYGFRIYNAALGRFLSIDPLSASYPWFTPFQFAGLNPITSIDIDGLEGIDFRNLPSAPQKASCHGTTPMKFIDDTAVFNKINMNKEIVQNRQTSRVESMPKWNAELIRWQSGKVNPYYVSEMTYTVTTTEQHIENWEGIGDVLVTTLKTTNVIVKFDCRYTTPALDDAILDNDMGTMEPVVESITEETKEFYYYQKILKQDNSVVEASNSQTSSLEKESTKSATCDDSNFDGMYSKLPDDVKKEITDILVVNGANMNKAIDTLPDAAKEVKSVIPK